MASVAEMADRVYMDDWSENLEAAHFPVLVEQGTAVGVDPVDEFGMCCFPNPFNPVTAIRYQLSAFSRVRVEVFGVRGNRVAVLVDEDQSAGSHVVRFDGTGLASGVYYCHIDVTGSETSYSQTLKMMLVK